MNRATSTAMIDALFLLLLVLVLLPHEPSRANVDAPDLLDAIVIEARWIDDSQADVDLWARSPADTGAVGYSRKQGSYLALVRDEIGYNSPPGERRELIMSRGTPDGEYAVNVHLYSSRSEAPIDVAVSVWVARDDGGHDLVWSGSVVLTADGQELTVIRWEMRDGVVLPGSMNDSPIELRSARR